MDCSVYTQLTGKTCTPEVEKQIKRTRAVLESMLGYTLDPTKVNTNLYNELGKSPIECSCSNVDVSSLLPPDSVQFAYRLYRYNNKDRFLFVDPFTELYKVKLVKDNITIRTFKPEEIRVQYGRDGIAKYIEVCETCFCICECVGCVQLAVDAKWQWQTIPDDLLYAWTDLIDYYIDCGKNIKSESIGPHSYTKFDQLLPQEDIRITSVLQRYAGPYGTLTVEPTQ